MPICSEKPNYITQIAFQIKEFPISANTNRYKWQMLEVQLGEIGIKCNMPNGSTILQTQLELHSRVV